MENSQPTPTLHPNFMETLRPRPWVPFPALYQSITGMPFHRRGFGYVGRHRQEA